MTLSDHLLVFVCVVTTVDGVNMYNSYPSTLRVIGERREGESEGERERERE